MAKDKNKDETGAAAPPKRGIKALILPLVMALVLGGGTFYAVHAGLVVFPALEGSKDDHKGASGDAKKGHDDDHETAADGGHGELPAFVALDPLIIALSEESRSRHLKLTLQAEAAPGQSEEVSALAPRILDVLNTYLRAVDEREFENPRAMARMRAQMLRRVQMVTPEGAVRDLLIQEFILN